MNINDFGIFIFSMITPFNRKIVSAVRHTFRQPHGRVLPRQALWPNPDFLNNRLYSTTIFLSTPRASGLFPDPCQTDTHKSWQGDRLQTFQRFASPLVGPCSPKPSPTSWIRQCFCPNNSIPKKWFNFLPVQLFNSNCHYYPFVIWGWTHRHNKVLAVQPRFMV